MNCPYCSKPMQIMYRYETFKYNEGKMQPVIGRCEDCDFDAKWTIDTMHDGTVREWKMTKYFFG